MDLQNAEAEAAFRAEIKGWLAQNAPAFELPATGKLSDEEEVARGRAWQRRLQDGGYAGIMLPESLGGRGGGVIEAILFAEEEARYRLPKGPYVGIGLSMAAPAIIGHGSEAQIQRFVPPILNGETTWCQLFSEPGAGSDLAALRTRAEWKDDAWILNGQKVWSSWAHHADWGIIVARTDPKAPKHKGLSFFLLDMRTPGIEVRPIRQISGASDFNETFLTDARIPDDCRIGAVGEGWACAMTTLSGERLGVGEGADALGGVGALIRLARATPMADGSALEDASIRTELACAYAEERAEKHFQARLRTMMLRGENPGALGAAAKLAYTARLQRTSGLVMEMRGLAGVAHDGQDLEIARVWHDYIWSAALRIAGGADEVLRNQIAERVLNLPGEVRSDKTAPFDEL